MCKATPSWALFVRFGIYLTHFWDPVRERASCGVQYSAGFCRADAEHDRERSRYLKYLSRPVCEQSARGSKAKRSYRWSFVGHASVAEVSFVDLSGKSHVAISGPFVSLRNLV